MFTKFHTGEEVLAALSQLRINVVTDEYKLHDIIAQSVASQHMDKVIEKLKELGKSKKAFKSA